MPHLRLRRPEKIEAVQRGDDLASGQKFFEIVTTIQLFVLEDALPESGRRGAEMGLAEKICGGVHRWLV